MGRRDKKNNKNRKSTTATASGADDFANTTK
jgi:hypothetical protein